jgi:hypothetical protein
MYLIKLRTTICATVLATVTFMSAKAQIKVGIQGGINISSPTVEGLKDKKNASSPTFGLVTQINIIPMLTFRPSVNYLQNAFSGSTTTTTGSATTTTDIEQEITNLEIPLDLVYPVKLKKGKLLLSAAPVLTIGLKGNQTTTVNTAGISPVTNEIKFGNQTAELKKIDWASRFGVGYEFTNGMQLNAAYKLGLTNQSNNNNTLKNHNVIVTLAWYFINK